MTQEYGNGAGAPRATSGVVWRAAREQGYLKQLPSGNWARLRPVSPDLLLSTGDLPDMLTPLVVKMVFEGSDGQEVDRLTDPQQMISQAADTVQLFNTVCRLAFLAPRIVDDPQAEDEISIEDIDLADRGFVFQLVTQPAEVLRRFRLEPAGDVAAVSDGQGDGDAAEPDGTGA